MTKTLQVLQWESEFSVGVEKIDDQHKEIMDLVNNLTGRSIQSRAGWKKQFERIIKVLADQALIHFQTEEELLSKTGYAGFDDHKKEHERLKAKLTHILNELDNIKWDVELFTLTTSFKEWFLSHILLYDKEAKDYFIAGAV